MTDLLARIPQRPGIYSDRYNDSWNWLSEMKMRAEFDRDLTLNALAALCRLEADGKHADECSIEAWETAQAILRELRGASLGEGAGQ